MLNDECFKRQRCGVRLLRYTSRLIYSTPFRPGLRDGDQLHLLSQIRQLSLNARVDHRRPGRKNKPPQKLTIFHEGQFKLPMNLRFELGLEAIHHLRIERISAPQLSAKDAALRVVQLRIEPKNLVEISDPSLSKKQTDEVRQNRPGLPLKKPGDQPLFFFLGDLGAL